MEHKVLIADDSLTIQKVIKITLANEPFELSDCANAEELVSIVRDNRPEIVLLDFNLSENKTGYDLCREIKELSPSTGVLMLFGTFDTIDEDLLAECGCNYHIVKPFDGNKFINLCRALAEDYETKNSEEMGEDLEFNSSEPDAPEESSGADSSEGLYGEDEWVVNQPAFEDDDEIDPTPLNQAPANDLLKEVEEWGMEVPSVIGSEREGAPEIPEIINEEEEAEPVKTESEEQAFDSLAEAEKESEEYPSEIELTNYEEKSTGTETEEDLRRIKDQIQDEVEDADLWAPDMIENEDFRAMDTEALEKLPEEDYTVDEAPSDFPEEVVSESKDKEEKESEEVAKEEMVDADELAEFEPEKIEANPVQPETLDIDETVDDIEAPASMDLSEISEKIKAELEADLNVKLSPMVERFVKDYCREQIEKVAWEVIPDLAENLIKKEIERISRSITDQ